jgi:hypothetical protein
MRLSVPPPSRASSLPQFWSNCAQILCSPQNPLWERACSRWRSTEKKMLNGPAPSRASPLPQGFRRVQNLCSPHQHCGSGLARESGLAATTMLRQAPDPPGRGMMAARFAAATRLSINPIHSRNKDDPLADRSGHR